MGIIQSYCCKDALELATEEESRVWTENNVNQQYGSCLPPRSPTVFKIVFPTLAPLDIDLVDSSNLNNSDPNKAKLIDINSSTSTSSLSSRSSPNKSSQTQSSPTPTPTPSSTPTKTSLARKSKLKLKPTDQAYSEHPAVIKEEYCEEQFSHLRSLILKNPEGQRQFKELLWSCIPWSAPGGKSGSTFMKTINDQFILKEMSKLELQSFLSISDEYFNYIKCSYENHKPSLLSTIFGIFRIVYTDSSSQSSSEYYFIVMRNLFYKRNIAQRFDLKGSVRNRLVDTDDPDNTEHVLMDENLLRIAGDHPLFIHAISKQILNECIDNDSRFLTSISVMDYSLLVGVDKENNELVLGIIDYVRPFTWDKKIERVVKSVVSMELPTIVEPELYRERFCEAMDKYFEVLPDDDDCGDDRPIPKSAGTGVANPALGGPAAGRGASSETQIGLVTGPGGDIGLNPYA